MDKSRFASNGATGPASLEAQRRDLGLSTRTRIATVDEFDRQYRDIKPGDENKIRRRQVASPNDSVLNAWASFYKSQDNTEVEAQAATDTLYGGQLHRLRKIHDEIGNIRGDALDTVQVAPVQGRHFSGARFNIGKSSKSGKQLELPKSHGVFKAASANYQGRLGQFGYNHDKPGKPKSRVPPMPLMLGAGKENRKENAKGPFHKKASPVRRTGHPIVEHPGKTVATDTAFMEAVRILEGQEEKRSGARSASAPALNARNGPVRVPAPPAVGTPSRVAKAMKSQPSAAPAVRMELDAPSAPQTTAEMKDPAAMAAEFRAKASILASRWAAPQIQPPTAQSEPMDIDSIQPASLTTPNSAPEPAPPRATAAEAPVVVVRSRPRVPAALSLGTSRWAVPGPAAAHSRTGSAQDIASAERSPDKGARADEDLALRPSPGRSTATTRARVTYSTAQLLALSLGSGTTTHGLAGMAEQFMTDR